MNKNSKKVSDCRRNRKARLVAAAGGKCLDCGYEGPPFMFDFDHRDPKQKLFPVGNKGSSVSYERTLAEALKCDLVCANCHRMRTHRQRCAGCGYCGGR